MKKLIAILAVALAIPTMSFAKGEGRYQIASGGSIEVWVLDTKTGSLRYCTSQGTFTIKAPYCSPSKDTSR